MKSLLLLPLLLLSPLAHALDLTFAWDPINPNQAITAVRLYEVTGGVTNVVATVPGNQTYATLTNYFPTAERQFFAKATNILGESLPSNTVSVPAKALAPGNIKLQVSSLDVPVPGVVELSRDLTDGGQWDERIRLTPASDGKVKLSLVHYPTEPQWWMREKPVASFTPVPMPMPLK